MVALSRSLIGVIATICIGSFRAINSSNAFVHHQMTKHYTELEMKKTGRVHTGDFLSLPFLQQLKLTITFNLIFVRK